MHLSITTSKNGSTTNSHDCYSLHDQMNAMHKSGKMSLSKGFTMTERSISRPMSSRSLKPSMLGLGMATLLITRSNWFPSFLSLSMSNAVLASVTTVAVLHHQNSKTISLFGLKFYHNGIGEIGAAKKARTHTVVVAILQLPL